MTDAAGRNDPVEEIRILVGKGAAVNAVNNAGMTPMRYTVQRGSWVQALIDGDMSAVLGEQGRE